MGKGSGVSTATTTPAPAQQAGFGNQKPKVNETASRIFKLNANQISFVNSLNEKGLIDPLATKYIRDNNGNVCYNDLIAMKLDVGQIKKLVEMNDGSNLDFTMTDLETVGNSRSKLEGAKIYEDNGDEFVPAGQRNIVSLKTATQVGSCFMTFVKSQAFTGAINTLSKAKGIQAASRLLCLRTAGLTIGKIIPGLNIALTGLDLGRDIYEACNAPEGHKGAAWARFGANAGCTAIGALIGTCICPGAGTIIGMGIGNIVGNFAKSINFSGGFWKSVLG